MALPALLPGVDTVTSTTEFEPSGDGPWSIVVALDGDLHEPFFPVGGSAFIAWQKDNSNVWIFVKINGWDPDTLTLSFSKVLSSVTPTTTTGPYSEWFVSVIDGPPEGFPFLGIIGLRISIASGANDFTVSAGSIRDSTDTVNLTLDSETTKFISNEWSAGDGGGAIIRSTDLPLAFGGGGTISSSGATVVGVGTRFRDDFDARSAIPDKKGGWLRDFTRQVAGSDTFIGSVYFTPAIISSGGIDTTVVDGSVTSQSDLSTTVNLGVTDATYRRGGICDCTYAVVLMLADATGVCDVGVSSFTGDGDAPDLPVGYTYWRVLGALTKTGADRIVYQPLYDLLADPSKLNAPDPWTVAIGDMYYAADTDKANAALPIGDEADVLTVASGLPVWLPPTSGGGVDVQTFTGSGTWNKPSSGTVALIRCWGGGASGGKGSSSQPGSGGGGAACNQQIIPLALLGSSESVTIGAGGTGQTVADTAGNPGGTTTFGAFVAAYGGGAGNRGGTGAGGGGGGGTGGVGQIGTTGGGAGPFAGGAGGFGYAAPQPSTEGGGGTGGIGGATTDATAGRTGGLNGGGGGGGGMDGAGVAAQVKGGDGYWGGGGGGGGANSVTGGSGGLSQFGGAGSAGTIDTNASSNGSVPGGGSGGTEGGNSGNGGAGKCIVYVW